MAKGVNKAHWATMKSLSSFMGLPIEATDDSPSPSFAGILHSILI